ncbi:MAG: hypothetical protein EBZ51_02635 [Synechococcaceae bacterium WB9_2_112]|nr:hypothetical protein [Synechococcaceae bacterium WB9_2_112]
MPESGIPKDPLAAHEVVIQRVRQFDERRKEQRRIPLPDEATVNVTMFRNQWIHRFAAEVIEIGMRGMRLAASVDQDIRLGDHCEISFSTSQLSGRNRMVVRWLQTHELIQVFGVEAETLGDRPDESDKSGRIA